MRHSLMAALGAASVALSGCGGDDGAQAARAMKDVNVIDESNLSDIMLTVGDPEESVAYFTRTLAGDPERVDLKRGLAKSLVRAQRPAEAARVWEAVAASPEGTADDRVAHADALIRSNEWEQAEVALNAIPPTHETFERYRLEAMVADFRNNWKKADSFYEIAVGLTTKPAPVYNNWGFSKLTRGDYAAAERLFIDALTFEPGMFTAKNNLVLARGAQRKYDLPVIQMTQTERAQLLHTMALTAIKQGDVSVGKGLLQEAIDTHPQYFEAAQRALDALDAG